MKYRVIQYISTSMGLTVEADTPEDAVEAVKDGVGIPIKGWEAQPIPTAHIVLNEAGDTIHEDLDSAV
jgi:hypothetical protein